MNNVFGAGLLSDATKPALERARTVVRRSKQTDPIALEHEAVRAGTIRPSVIRWSAARVDGSHFGENVRVTVLIPVDGGVSALSLFPGPSRWLIPQGLGGVRYGGSPWSGYNLTCSRVFGRDVTPGRIQDWRRSWCGILRERVGEANELIAKHNASVRSEVRHLVDLRTGTSRRIAQGALSVDGRIDG